jgi:hypothetical protein
MNNKFKALLNALLAEGYIILVALVMYYGVTEIERETIFIPIFMLSLFVLSVLVMGYLFLFHPIKLYLDDEKKNALELFFWTVGWFVLMAVIDLIVLLLV